MKNKKYYLIIILILTTFMLSYNFFSNEKKNNIFNNVIAACDSNWQKENPYYTTIMPDCNYEESYARENNLDMYCEVNEFIDDEDKVLFPDCKVGENCYEITVYRRKCTGTICEKGKYLKDNNCYNCPGTNYYCPGERASFLSLPEHSKGIANSNGNYDFKCAGGYYKNGSKCVICPKGYYCVEGTNALTIYNICGAGTYSKEGAFECTQCTRQNEYQDEIGQSSCKKCSGKVDSEHKTCSTNISCGTGEYKTSSGTCVNCPKGYTSNKNSTSITDCYIKVGKGTYLRDRYDSELTLCEEGTYLDKEEIVYYSNKSINNCLACPKGTYSDKKGSNSCASCGDGYTTKNTGSISKDNCQKKEEEIITPPTINSNVDCNKFSFIINIVIFILKVMEWAIPIILILLITIDFLKAMIGNNQDKKNEAFNKTGKRLLYALIFFLIPVIIKLSFRLINNYIKIDATSWIRCFDEALNK